MIGQLTGILGPILIITLIGFILGRSSANLQARTLSTLVLLVATPALIFSTLTSMEVDGAGLRLMVGAALFCLTVAGVLGFIVIKLVGGTMNSVLPTLMLPNSGNMGLPLVVLTFGDAGMQLGISYFFVVALFQNSVGMAIASGGFDWRALAQQPLPYAVVIVLIVVFLDIPVPEVLAKTTQMLGGMMIPTMLILLGTSLATLTVSDIKPAVLIAIGRLVIGVISAFIVILTFGLTGVAAGAVFLLATMPTAIVTYVFAERFGRDAQQVAGAVVVSTLLTFLCLPGLVTSALWISQQDAGLWRAVMGGGS
jgi:malate permease and related proteins